MAGAFDTAKETIEKDKKEAIEEVKSKKLVVNNLGYKVSKIIYDQIKEIKGINSVNSNDLTEFAAVGTKGFYQESRKRAKESGKKEEDLYSATQAFLLGEEDMPNTGCESYNSLALGEAPVMNPPWQWNELDDVRSDPSYPRLGRVYKEAIYSNYPIIVFQPGRAVYSKTFNLSRLMGFGTSGLLAHDLNDYIRSGGEQNILKAGLSLIKNIVVGTIDMAFSIIFGADKFIEFKPSMKLFCRYVNEMYRELAANMRLLEWMDEEPSPASGNIEYNEEDSMIDKYQKDDYGGEGSSYRGTVKKLSLMNILPGSRKVNIRYELDSDTGLVKTIAEPETIDIWKEFHNHGYISYMCQSGITVSETFSNTSEPHPIVQRINEVAKESSDKSKGGLADSLMTGVEAFKSGGDIFTSGKDAIQSFAKSVAGKLAGEVMATGSELGLLFTGGGQASFPEIWSNSSYSRSYSLSIKLFSPVGSTVGIFENLWVPAIPLITLTAPRQTAKNVYYSPFMCKVYSKGLFSIPFGMIESLTIRRGEGKNDRTVFNYPRTLSIDIQIKDMSPVLMLSLGGARGWFGFHKENDGIHEYLATLANLSIADRLSIKQRWNRYWAEVRGFWTESVFNLQHLGFNLASTFIMKPIMMWRKGSISVDHQPRPSIY